MSQKATVQSKLSFMTSVKRPRTDDDYEPETTITQSVEATTEVTTADATPLAPAKEDSATLKELRHVTKAMARDTLRQLEIGYSPRSSGQVAAAIRNEISCILVQKVANRSENGYIQIPPVGFLSVHREGKKTLPQNAHRLVVIAFESEEDIEHLLNHGWHASHLCHEPTCINPVHICVEPKDKNEDRKCCKGRITIRCRIGGVWYVLKAKPCPHEPKCIEKAEERVAELE